MAAPGRPAVGALGQLHGVAAPDRFGRGVDCERSPPLRGDPPAGDPSHLRFPDGHGEWVAYLREWFGGTLDRLPETRFDDLEPALREAVEERIAALSGPFTPVLARMDHRYRNLLVDDDGTVRGVVDWDARFVGTPACDLVTVEGLLAGWLRTLLPEVDRRPLVRDALLAGYREERPLPPTLGAERACYRLHELVQWTWAVDRGIGPPRGLPDERTEAAATELRERVAARLD